MFSQGGVGHVWDAAPGSAGLTHHDCCCVGSRGERAGASAVGGEGAGSGRYMAEEEEEEGCGVRSRSGSECLARLTGWCVVDG